MRWVDVLMLGGLIAFAASALPGVGKWRARLGLMALLVAGVAGFAALALFHWQALPGVVLAAVLLVACLIRMRGSPRHSISRQRRGIAMALLLVAILGSVVPYYFYPLIVFPQPDGPFAVGVRDFDLLRPRGGAAGSGDRALVVRVWYPAASVEGLPGRRYFTRAEALEQLPNYQYLHLYDVRTAARTGAKPNGAGESWPVVVFNHGYMSYIGQNTALMEQLASHGYVAFSLSHPHDATSYTTLSGTRVEAHPWAPSPALVASLKRFIGDPSYEGRYRGYEDFRRAISRDRLAQSVADWRDDNLYLVDQLASPSPPAAVADLTPRLDLTKLAYTGMSFGGGTAATVCQADVRCKAVVSLDGVNWDLRMFDAGLRTPLLFLQSDWLTHPLFPDEPREPDTNPQDLAYERWLEAGLRPDIHRYRIENIAHLGLMDLTLLARSPLRDKRFGEIDGHQAIAIMNTFTLEFLDAQLRGASNGFPEAIETRYPEVRRHGADRVRQWWQSRAP